MLTSPIHKGLAPNTDAAGGGCHRAPGRVSEKKMKLRIPFARAAGVKGCFLSTGSGVQISVGKWVRL